MALDLLQEGVDRSVITLRLGHESVETTQIYLEATLAMKEQALAKTTPPNGRQGRYRPGDALLGFLNSCSTNKTMPSHSPSASALRPAISVEREPHRVESARR
jgi:hypothetical protein